MIEAIDIQTQLQEKWLISLWALGISLFALGIAWGRGFFKPFHASALPIIRGTDVLKGFGVFLFTEILLVPMLIGFVWGIIHQELLDLSSLKHDMQGWFNLIIILGGFAGVSLIYFGLTPLQRQQLWHQTSTSWLHNISIGIASWFVSYPIVLAFSQLLSIAVWYLFHHPFIEQVVVQHLRKILDNPLLFGLTGFAVVVLVPLTEEFLFRGLLQNWLKSKVRTVAAIGITSLVFALFHYSSTQGVTNIELLSSLFLLSCMLGFVYERQRSLWASVGLHGFFNFISLLMIFKEP